MKTKLFLSALLSSFSILLFAQCPAAGYTCIPDEVFEQYLINQNWDDSLDGRVLTDNIDEVEIVGVAALGIMSLEGIEDFAALRRLVCNNNSIGTLDLSSNTSLEALYCHFNEMTSLTLPDTPTLFDLQCYRNSLMSLDVSKNEGLKVLWCYNNSIQNTLDASSCTILENFDCGENEIGAINMPDDSDTLVRFLCDGNNIVSLDVSKNTVLTELQCHNNPSLGPLNLENNQLLESFFCYDNSAMTSIVLPEADKLWRIWGSRTGLTSLDASGLTGLEFLRLNNSNSLTSLTLPNTATLQTFWMYGHALANIDFTPYTNLHTGLLYLDISNGNLTDVDVSMLQNLVEFYCYDSNDLTSLNIKNNNNTALIYMYANNSPNLNCIQVDNKLDAEIRNSIDNWRKDDEVPYEENCSTAGIDNFGLSSVYFYPNPAKNKLQLELELEASYKLFNVHGQEILKGVLASGLNELDISVLRQGLYFLTVENNLVKTTNKLIKE